jgi:hypothetical protein
MGTLRGTLAFFDNEYLISSFDSIQAMRNCDDRNPSTQFV